MHGISYRIRLLEPALLNSPAGDNNTAQSYRFLPGSVIRGAIIAAYLAQPGRNGAVEGLDAADEDARRLFFSGATRYLHAYPHEKRYTDRALPAPLSWYQDKDDEVSADYTIDVFDLSVAWKDDRKQLRTIKRDAFCAVTRDSVYQLDCAPRLNVHTQRDALPGRATEERGAIYRYEALPAGASLAGVILTQSADDAEALQKLLNGLTAYLGKARTAGYGGACFEDVKLLTTNWFETGSDNLAASVTRGYPAAVDAASEGDFEVEYLGEESSEYEEGEIPAPAAEAEDVSRVTTLNEFSVTLLSAAIVRDEQGHYTLDPLPALRRRLGALDGAELDLAVVDERRLAFRRSDLIGGFNRKWNLPLPQVAAIAAGSVFKVTAALPIALDRLRALEETGIGERRAEGFGRVAVNWQLGSVLSYAKPKDEKPAPEPVGELSEAARRMAEHMLQRLLRRDLDEALAKAVSGININTQSRIANSQLSRWRAILRSALAEPDSAKRLNRLTDFYAAEEKKASAAWEAMRRARIEVLDDAGRKQTPRLTDWLKDTLVAENKLQEVLGPLPERNMGEVAQATVTPKLDLEYRIRLIEAVLARKAKQQAKPRVGKGGRNEDRN